MTFNVQDSTAAGGLGFVFLSNKSVTYTITVLCVMTNYIAAALALIVTVLAKDRNYDANYLMTFTDIPMFDT